MPATARGSAGRSDDRRSRIRSVVEFVTKQRAEGNPITDSQIVGFYSELMPELGEALKQTSIVGKETSTAINLQGENTEPVGACPTCEFEPVEIPGYEIVELIATAGQAAVYLGRQKSVGRNVAIKVIRHAGSHARYLHEQEVRVLGRLKHHNIVTIFDSGITAHGVPYYVMDYIQGGQLNHYVVGRKLSLREKLALFAKVCDGVMAAHLRGVIHRDLKPANIRVTPDGEPKIIDFGLIVSVSGELIEDCGAFMGTLAYASPEQVEMEPARIDLRTDIYSLGVILYELLTGQFPYPLAGDIREAFARIRDVVPAPPSSLARDVPARVDAITLRCLEKDRDRRYQSAGELAAEIRGVLAGQPTQRELEHRSRTNRRLLLASASLNLFLLLALLAMLVKLLWA